MPNPILGLSVQHDPITPEKMCFIQIEGLSLLIPFMGGFDIVSLTIDEQERIENCYFSKKCFKIFLIIFVYIIRTYGI